MKRSNWKRLFAGSYEATINGHNLWVVNHRHYTGKPSNVWNVIVDGECDHAIATKREAIRMAEICAK